MVQVQELVSEKIPWTLCYWRQFTFATCETTRVFPGQICGKLVKTKVFGLPLWFGNPHWAKGGFMTGSVDPSWKMAVAAVADPSNLMSFWSKKKQGPAAGESHYYHHLITCFQGVNLQPLIINQWEFKGHLWWSFKASPLFVGDFPTPVIRGSRGSANRKPQNLDPGACGSGTWSCGHLDLGNKPTSTNITNIDRYR